MLTRYYQKIRAQVQDSLAPGYDPFEFMTSRVFTLSMASVDATTLKVYKNKVQVINVTGTIYYTFDSSSKQVTFTSSCALVAGDLIECYYNGYEKYTDNELHDYILSAIVRLSAEDYYTFALREDGVIFPVPVESDENLICLIASILMDNNISRYRTQEIEIQFAGNESESQRIDKILRKWKKCYGTYDYIKFKWNIIPFDSSFGNLH